MSHRSLAQNGTILKILIVHNSLNDGTSMSGVLKHYLLMARAWVDAGHQVDFMMAKAGFPQIESQAPFCGRICSDSFFDASQYIDQTWRYFPAFGFRLISSHFVRSSRDYDVVYASNFLIFEVYPALTMARRCGAKLVVKIQHLLHSQSGRHSFFDRLFLKSEKWSMQLACRHADLIMCLSRPVENDFILLAEQLKLTERNPHVVGCGLDFTELDNTPHEEPKYDLVFLGRMHEQKGVFDLADVWESVINSNPDARMVVIGEGPHRKMLMQSIEAKGLSDSVTFTGGIDEPTKNKLIRQSKLGLSLSYEEGWGLSVTEFLAAGLPVVAYELPVFKELFDNVLQFVPLKSKSQAAERILSLLENPELLQNLGLKGRKHVRQFNYQEVAEKELSLMQGLF
jgi:glycosyltransferase involved in cell wall biosynthesis